MKNNLEDPNDFTFKVKTNQEEKTFRRDDVILYLNADKSVKCLLSSMSEGDTVQLDRAVVLRVA